MPFDQFQGGNRNALTQQQQQGMSVFGGKGQCIQCYGGAELTNASVSNVLARGIVSGVTDTGFANIGVRPGGNDPGLAGTDPFNNPLSATGNPVAVNNLFIIPGLRNVELNGPYFHNGRRPR